MRWQDQIHEVAAKLQELKGQKKIEIARALGISTALLFEYQLLWKYYDQVSHLNARSKAYELARVLHYRNHLSDGDTFSSDEDVKLYFNTNPNRELRKYHGEAHLTVIHDSQLEAYPDVGHHLFQLGRPDSWLVFFTGQFKMRQYIPYLKSLGFHVSSVFYYHRVAPKLELASLTNEITPVIVARKGGATVLSPSGNFVMSNSLISRIIEVPIDVVTKLCNCLVPENGTIIEPVCEVGEWANHRKFVGITTHQHLYLELKKKLFP